MLTFIGVKKFVAILLVSLVLFNALGFYGLLEGLRYKSTVDLVQRLDNNHYSKNETITIKIPFAIPYQLSQADHQRVNGEIEYNGEFYRLVSQKLSRDTLFIVCIKDQVRNRIQEALANYVQTFTDKPAHTKNTGKTFTLIKDFLPTKIEISSKSEGWNYAFTAAPIQDHFKNRSLIVFTPPPKS